VYGIQIIVDVFHTFKTSAARFATLSGENDTFIDNSLFYFGKGSKKRK